MIIKEQTLPVDDFEIENSLEVNECKDLFKDAVFFDLEHYVYKKPICVGVFGAAYYDCEKKELKITQYMLENKYELKKILNMSKEYFIKQKNNLNKKYVVTFSGNNDFLVINYLMNKHKINYKISDHFSHIDLQKMYELDKGTSIGLKNLESIFGITRESELISGSNLAKTFGKIMKDDEYSCRMPLEKKDKILLYNKQDVVSLFYIYVNWKKHIVKKLEEEIINEEILNDNVEEDSH